MGVKSKALKEEFNHKDYFNYLHNSNQKCVICGGYNIEIHHITDVHKIKGDRRDHKRVVTLCKNHHKESKFGIHNMSKEDFYENVMSLESLLFHSSELLEEYKREKGI